MERKTGIPKASGNSMKFQESAGSVVGYTSYNLFHVSGITIFLVSPVFCRTHLSYIYIYSLQLADKCILNYSHGYGMHN